MPVRITGTILAAGATGFILLVALDMLINSQAAYAYV